MNYREFAVFGAQETGQFDVVTQSGAEQFAQRKTIVVETEAEWSAEDDAIGAIAADEWGESQRDAGRDVSPIVRVGDFVDIFAMEANDGVG